MPAGPAPADVPRIRVVLAVYRVSAVITGVFLLLLCLMMVLRYGFGVDIEWTAAYGFQLTPKDVIEAHGGLNVSTIILIVHGWFYVLYLACDFLLWRFTRWSFGRFLFIALGGIVPLLSFFFEFRLPRWVREVLSAAKPEERVVA
jgi:integral membrane protein